MAGVTVAYVSGLGSVVLVLIILGVRPGNFVRWAVSPVGLAIIIAVAFFGVREWRRH